MKQEKQKEDTVKTENIISTKEITETIPDVIYKVAGGYTEGRWFCKKYFLELYDINTHEKRILRVRKGSYKKALFVNDEDSFYTHDDTTCKLKRIVFVF